MGNTIEQYARREIDLVGRLRAAKEKIGLAEAAAGAAILDSENETGAPGCGVATEAVDALARAKAEVQALESAIKACRVRRLEAVKTKRAEAAAALRKQAAEMREQLEKLKAKTAKHLAEISELEGMPFALTPAPAPGMWGTVPLSQTLQNDALAADLKAASLEVEVPRNGSVTIDDATSVDPLILAVLQHPSDGPAAEDIAAWAAAVETRGVDTGASTYAPRQPRAFGSHHRRLHLEWKNGAIDTGESFIQVGALARRPPGPVTGAPGFELGSDIFKAAMPATGLGL